MAWSILQHFSASTESFYLWGERVACCAQCFQSPSALCCALRAPLAPDIWCHGFSSSDLPALQSPCSLKLILGSKEYLYEFLICFLKFLNVIKIALLQGPESPLHCRTVAKTIWILFSAEDTFKLWMCASVPTHQTSLRAKGVLLFQFVV